MEIDAGQGLCDECGSPFRVEASPMASLCPECAHILYRTEACSHSFIDGQCTKCLWNGSVSDYCLALKGKGNPGSDS